MTGRIYRTLVVIFALEISPIVLALTQQVHSRSCENYRNTTIPKKKIGTDIHGWPVCMPLFGAGTWQYNDTLPMNHCARPLTLVYIL